MFTMPTKFHYDKRILHTINFILPKLLSRQHGQKRLHSMLRRILHERSIYMFTFTKWLCHRQQHWILSSMFLRLCSKCKWYLLHIDSLLSILSTCDWIVFRMYYKLLFEYQPNLYTNVGEQLFICKLNGTMYSMCTRFCSCQ